MGLSIVGGTDQACPPFGKDQRGVFVSKVNEQALPKRDTPCDLMFCFIKDPSQWFSISNPSSCWRSNLKSEQSWRVSSNSSWSCSIIITSNEWSGSTRSTWSATSWIQSMSLMPIARSFFHSIDSSLGSDITKTIRRTTGDSYQWWDRWKTYESQWSRRWRHFRYWSQLNDVSLQTLHGFDRCL